MTSHLFESIKTLSSIQPEHIRKYDRMEVVIRFMQAKKDHPDYKKNQICALIGVSDSYLKRVMKDLDIKSFYRYDIPVHRRRSKKEQKVGQKSDNGITEIAAHVETPSTDSSVSLRVQTHLRSRSN